MAYIQTPYLEFRELVERHIKEMEREAPERDSRDWYFLRYLRRVRKQALDSPNARGVTRAMDGLVRYYLDAVEPRSHVAERFEEVLAAHRRALRLHRQED